MNHARKRIHELLYGQEATLTRNLHEALDKIGDEWQADKAEITRLRNAMEEVCGDYESRGVAHNSLYYAVLRKALEGEE